MLAVNIWGRLGWRETKRRYRRTIFGPFWTTVGLALFVTVLGLVWSNLWHRDPKTYLPYLTSGMVCWVLFSTICTEGCMRHHRQRKAPQAIANFIYAACMRHRLAQRRVFLPQYRQSTSLVCHLCRSAASPGRRCSLFLGLRCSVLNAIWITVLLGALCARYRDIQQLVSTLLQISMFLTPIFWSPDQLTGRTIDPGGIQSALPSHCDRS